MIRDKHFQSFMIFVCMFSATDMLGSFEWSFVCFLFSDGFQAFV